MHGVVKKQSLLTNPSGYRFTISDISDADTTLSVDYKGKLSMGFTIKEGRIVEEVKVVLEGQIMETGIFEADRIRIKREF